MVGELIGVATIEKNGLMSKGWVSKLGAIPIVSSYTGNVGSGEFVAIPVNSDVIGAGFVRIGLCVNHGIGYGFNKASYDMIIMSGRQYDFNVQQGICNGVVPNGNTVSLKSIIYNSDNNDILRNIYLKFTGNAYISVFAENCTGNISIVSSATGFEKTITKGFGVSI